MSQTPPTPESPPGQEDPQKSRPTPKPPVKMSRGVLSWMLIIAVLIMLFAVLNGTRPGQEIATWGDFMALANPANGKILDNTVELKATRIQAVVKPGVEGFSDDPAGTPIWIDIAGGSYEYYLNQLDDLGVDHAENTATPIWQHLLMTYGFVFVLLLVLWFFIARSVRSAGSGPAGMLGTFGKSRHKMAAKDSIDVTFDDVAGIDEAKAELHEIVEFLKSPKRFQRLGGRIPRGVLLAGPPGCGKTLLAKAIAGEADVPFFSISGSDFVEMFVGVGASRVRDLFKQAKENSPCIIFLDEIDAVGRRRGGGFSSGGHDEREQTLNAILVEMDGFGANDQVIVIAATNRADVLDPALMRPGRFDRQVEVPFADLLGRRKILEVHGKAVRMGPDVDLERLARGTPMFSGADLEAVINEAAIFATMADKDCIEQEDLEEARDKIRFGRARRSRKIEELERVATAYHEAGHATIQMLLEDADPVHKVTIIPRGPFGGATFSLPEKDRYGFGRKFLEATIRVLCAGRIAEQRKTGDISSGAGGDIKMATDFARHMILEWGMSEKVGFVHYAGDNAVESIIPDRDYSPETARIIDEEVKRFIDEAYADTEGMLAEHWDQVVVVADALLQHETLQGEEIKRLMAGESLDRPTVAELLESESSTVVDSIPGTDPNDDVGGDELVPSPA